LAPEPWSRRRVHTITTGASGIFTLAHRADPRYLNTRVDCGRVSGAPINRFFFYARRRTESIGAGRFVMRIEQTIAAVARTVANVKVRTIFAVRSFVYVMGLHLWLRATLGLPSGTDCPDDTCRLGVQRGSYCPGRLVPVTGCRVAKPVIA
jgi:hypothetical protein